MSEGRTHAALRQSSRAGLEGCPHGDSELGAGHQEWGADGASRTPCERELRPPAAWDPCFLQGRCGCPTPGHTQPDS